MTIPTTEKVMFKVPISASRGTIFDYLGSEIRLSAVRFNKFIGDSGAYLLDISWIEEDVKVEVRGLSLTSGIDILSQHSTPIPNLYAVSGNNPASDIISTDDLHLYILN